MNSSSDNSYSFQDSKTRDTTDDLDITNNDSESQSRGAANDSSSDDDIPFVRRIQSKRNILRVSSSGEEFGENNDELSPIVHKNRNKQKAINSLDSDSDAHTNKIYSSTASTSSASKSLGSFVDSNLFGDESRQNSTLPDLQERRKSKKSSALSLAKSFTKYRSTRDASSSDEEETNVRKDQSAQEARKNSVRRESTETKSFTKYRATRDALSSDEEETNVRKDQSAQEAKKNSVRRESTNTQSVSELVVSDSEDDKFEAEFEKNVYSPRTRKSITGVGSTSILSESEDEVLIETKCDTIEGVEPIEIPDSDTESETNSIENSDANLSNMYLDHRPLNVSGLKNPLQASSPLLKPMLQPTLTKLAKTYVSQEFFDKQVMKLNDMENELQKSIQLRGAFQIKLPDDGRRLSGRIDRLKQDIEQQQQYIQTLEVQTSFSQNEIKTITKPAPPTKVIELSWDALDAATNEVKPKYTGTIGLSTFNTQKALTLDSLKDIHESISSCPAPDKFAEDPIGLKVELMPHQKHALLWLAWRETQQPRGGILADDMGLGKTLTIIAHVLTEYYRKENCSEEENSDENQNPHNGWTAKGRKDQYSGGTLVVCPASLIGQWEHEIKTRLKRDILSYVVHHGTKRDVKARHLAKADIVITTYNIVSRECPGNNRGGPLSEIKWDRVVLDEAHVIRNHKTRMSESVTSLSRRSSWILTGTPIQNKEMDMFSLLRFLKCRPFDDLSQFKKWIDNKNAGGQLRMNTILKAILLRRTKAELISAGGLLTMPTKVVRVIDVILERDEMNVYQKIMLYSQTLFAQYLYQRADKDDGISFNYNKPKANSAFHKAHKMLLQMHSGNRDVKSHEILVLLLRLRQICVHPGLITAMLEDADRSAVYEESTSEQDSVDIDLMEQLNRLNVNENDDVVSFELPESDSRMAKASKKVLLKSNPVFDLSRPSSKFLKVLEVLKKDVLSKNENAVIVSQWTHVLEVIGMTLKRNGISYTSLTGSVPVKDRGAIVERFNNKSQHSKILLLSLTAGGVGLNLVGGNHLLLIDLHWNPQLEAQAQDRIYRVGQIKPVTIYKFVSKDTIEERIKKLQEIKLEIANGVLTGTGTNGSKLSIDDLKSLFDL